MTTIIKSKVIQEPNVKNGLIKVVFSFLVGSSLYQIISFDS